MEERQCTGQFEDLREILWRLGDERCMAYAFIRQGTCLPYSVSLFTILGPFLFPSQWTIRWATGFPVIRVERILGALKRLSVRLGDEGMEWGMGDRRYKTESDVACAGLAEAGEGRRDRRKARERGFAKDFLSQFSGGW